MVDHRTKALCNFFDTPEGHAQLEAEADHLERQFREIVKGMGIELEAEAERMLPFDCLAIVLESHGLPRPNIMDFFPPPSPIKI